MNYRKKRFSKEEKFSQISTLEGYLFKLSPQFLVGYQRRYFCVRDGGRKLIYYKTKPEIKDKPKGMLEIKDILNLQKKNKTDFSFQYEERKFELRANDEAECDKWIFSLDFLKGYITALENQKAREEQIEVQVHISSPQAEKKKEKWRINNLDSQTFNEIQAEHERSIINQKKESKETPVNSLDDYNRILDLKGIKPFIEKLDPKVVKSRLCMGFLSKKGKNNITRYQKRFFVLISAKPLSEGLKDDIILKEEDLPPWLELETIYYFQCKSNDDSSPFIGKISLRNVINITVEDNQTKNALENLKQDFIDFSSNLKIMKGLFSWETNLGLTKPENGFGFTLATKDRTYYFYADLITEMNKWIIAIEQSTKNYKELHPDVLQNQDLTINDKSPRKKMMTSSMKKNINDFQEEEDEVTEIPLLGNNQMKDSLEKQKLPLMRNSQLKESNTLAKEGYLFKKTLTTNKLKKLIGWKQRYVILREDTIFWVESNTQKNDSKKQKSMQNVTKCEQHKDSQFLLTIGQKNYKFKTETKEDRDKWVQLINKARANFKHDEPIDNKMTISSESEANLTNINGTGASMEILKVNVSRGEDVEDSIFARFYALNDDRMSGGNVETLKMKETSSYRDSRPKKKQCYCFTRLLCCFKKQEETEEDYYSQL